MYQAHWGLRQPPFRDCLDRQAFFESPTHEEALARLHFLAEEHRRLGLLVGPSGSGKSLLLDVFAAQLHRRGCPVARLSLLGIEPNEMLHLLAAEWGLNVEPSHSTGMLWRALTDRLIEYRYQQLQAVVLLDDADYGVLQHVARLARFDPSPEMRLTIVLAGREEMLSRLPEPLLDLAELRIDVEPWQQTDTEDFLAARLSAAGRQTPVFTPPAVERLHEVARGIPRRVSQLANLSLVAGAGRDLPQIGAEVVDEAYQELGVVE